jgi:hypothetical protein
VQGSSPQPPAGITRRRCRAVEREDRMSPQLPEGEVQIAGKGVHGRHLTARSQGIFESVQRCSLGGRST